MRLLLLLSALIAGMTGLVAGHPAAARSGEPAAVAAALSGAIEQASEAASVRPAAVVRFISTASRRHCSAFARLTPKAHPVDERCLE